MSQKDLEPVARESGDITRERLEALRDLFPEAFGEDGLDFERLRATLGDFVDDSPERYRFTWSGKRDAIRAFQVPSRATLVPDRDNSVGWDETGHVFIEGENLEVLKLLYRSYFGRVKCIYIDPPYNTGNDFVYPDDYADPLEQYLRVTGQKDAEGNLLTSNPETGGRYHSAWLSMMYPRLFLARQLLTEDGVIFVSIGQTEVHNLRILMNEVFGEESLDAQVVWQKVYSPRMDAKGYTDDVDYLLAYRRAQAGPVGRLGFTQNEKQFTGVDEATGRRYRPRSLRKEGKNSRRADRPNLYYPIDAPDETPVLPIRSDGSEGCWRWSEARYNAAVLQGVIEWSKTDAGWQVYVKQYLDEDATRPPGNLWPYADVGHNHEAVEELRGVLGRPVFSNPKPTRLVRRMLEIAAAGDDDWIILDFFSGSGTTAQAVLELNREDGGSRRFVMVQLPEPLDQPQTLHDGTTLGTIADIGRERIRRVITRMQERETGTLDISEREPPEDLGFRAFRLVPSNYRPESEAGDTGDAAALFTQPLADGWTLDGLLHEIALKEGFDLGVQIEQVAGVATNTVYRLTDPYKEQTCLVCLDEKLHADTAKALNLTREDLFICLDSALDDTLAANLALQCRLKVI